MSRFRQHLSYANVMATVAVFVALGGSSYAAVKLGRNAVSGRNIAPNAITSPKVRDGSLLARDFRAGQLPAGARGPQGDQGPKGDPGERGPTGDTGQPGAAGATHVAARFAEEESVAPGAESNIVAACLPGERATGGGGGFLSNGVVEFSIPNGSGGAGPDGSFVPDRWRVKAKNASTSSQEMLGYVICASP